MGGNDRSDQFQFQGQVVSDAVDVLDGYRGVDRDELGRRGVTRILREVTTGEEKAVVFTQYQRAEIDEDVARVFLGDRLDAMLADAEVIREAIKEDETSGLVL